MIALALALVLSQQPPPRVAVEEMPGVEPVPLEIAPLETVMDQPHDPAPAKAPHPGDTNDPAAKPLLERPLADKDAGIFAVYKATATADDTEVGAGWWLSPERMSKVGERLSALERENYDLKNQTGPMTWLAIGAGAGFVVGVGLSVWLLLKLPSAPAQVAQ